MFICDDMYCDGSITVMWSLKVFINDFPLPCRQVKDQSFQDIRLRPAVHKLCFNLNLMLIATYHTVIYLKSFNCNETSQQQNLTLSSKMLFTLQMRR